MNEKETTIIIADRFYLVRQALRNLIEKQKDLKVIAEAGDGREAINVTVKLQPDIVIINMSMTLISGLEVIRQVRRKCPGVKILVLTIRTTKEYIERIKQAGANGYLAENVPADMVINAIRKLDSGIPVFPAVSTQESINQASTPVWENLIPNAREADYDTDQNTDPHYFYRENALYTYEYELLRLIAKGLSNKEIATKMGNTTERHIKGRLTLLFTKLGASSRTEAVAAGVRSGLLIRNDFF